MSLVDMLKSLDLNITLLVERVDGYGLCERAPDIEGKFSKIINSAEISEIYRYFQEKVFDFTWDLRPISFRFSTGSGRKHVNKSLFEHMNRRPALIDNVEDSQDIYPQRGGHLKAFHEFLWMDYVYSDAPAFCRNNIAPIKVDAKEFDYVVVDSPHYIVLEGIDRKKVFNVIHDVIPVTDPSWSWDWRTMFVQKLKAGITSSSNYIFVSEFTKNEFSKVFGSPLKASSSEIIYPSIKESRISASTNADKTGNSDYISGISKDKPAEKIRNVTARLNRAGQSVLQNSDEFQQELSKFGNWNGSLPYVCTILADEERKNIPAVIAVSKKFLGQVNFIIMGKIDGNKYLRGEPESFPNVHFTGFVSESQKEDILKNAVAFVFPSFSEGFGIPIVEAGLYNTPIVCADIPIFREISGEKAIYFDPHSTESFAKAIRELLLNKDRFAQSAISLRPSLVDRFSEKQMVRRLDVYLKR